MTFIPLSLSTLLTLFLPVIGSSPIAISTTHQSIPTPQSVEERLPSFATRAEGGGGGIGIGAIAGIIIAVLAVLLLILFFIIHSRRRSSLPMVAQSYPSPPGYTAPPTKIYYPSQKHYPTLPKYTGPNTSAAYVPSSGGIRLPSAIHPSSRGYYGQRGEVERGVRFGGVGVRGYH
ncbi:hypothetical protein I302_106864 [Kwoniella bestiolae CBS 10118]|uniref:Transmembrane protein n=1 Tax=Kwoniella bestiolae CBS 10118 TaxID=1296100 RepID=A0A1B9G069_9TREE|nr:hypothetical protein I302_05870 [Kwoniella bestiolae CBS 10118]OCF24410.1 hypothetical protein I302_05870 [Kwoniella bestiolae CBS 10118]